MYNPSLRNTKSKKIGELLNIIDTLEQENTKLKIEIRLRNQARERKGYSKWGVK
mgnify:CR=1 FL=1|tara:strand:- start:3511 stop:3672 length:162 start_codon:yes stop_codon:yes gene_type:complete